jgi:hypothetical protein
VVNTPPDPAGAGGRRILRGPGKPALNLPTPDELGEAVAVNPDGIERYDRAEGITQVLEGRAAAIALIDDTEAQRPVLGEPLLQLGQEMPLRGAPADYENMGDLIEVG